MTAPADQLVLTDHRRAQIKSILWSVPALVEGGTLTLVYAQNRKREAAWLYAYAQAAGVAVRLSPARAAAILGAVREAPADSTVMVLSDHSTELPAGTIHLFGSESDAALDLWTAPDVVASVVERAAGRLAGRSSFTLDGHGWTLTAYTGQATAGPYPMTVDAAVTAADGTFVADVAVAVNRPVKWDARLSGDPIAVTVEDSVVVEVRGGDGLKADFVRRALTRHRVDFLETLRFGLHDGPIAPCSAGGPANVVRRGVGIILTVRPGCAYLGGSANLSIGLYADWDGDLR